jgi:hypothetical protein
MANTISRQTIIDGSRQLVVKIYLESDGSSGELTDYVLIDASTYSPPFTDWKIISLNSNLVGFTAKLKWDATTDVPFATLPDYDVNYSHQEFDDIMGFPNNAGTGRTGDLLISTSGFATAGDYGTIVIHGLKKNEVVTPA